MRRLIAVPAAAALLMLAACQPAARATPTADPAPTPPTAPAQVPKPEVHPSDPAPQPAPAQVVLAVGQDAAVANGRLKLLRVVSDSRCPKDAQCIWEGEVTLAFEFVDAGGAHPFQLAKRGQPSASVGDTAFTIAGFGPCPAGHGAPAECATVTTAGAALR
jgi:hypothetical protein